MFYFQVSLFHLFAMYAIADLCTTSNDEQFPCPLSDKKYCGYQHSDDYFRNENGTDVNEFPWLAALIYEVYWQYDRNYTIVCGGSLINSRYVLTAAQCLRRRDSRVVGARLGEYDVKSSEDCTNSSQLLECAAPVEEYGLEEVITHPNYNRLEGVHDIALLRLNRTVIYSDYIRPICLPIIGFHVAKAGDTLISSGWGNIGNWLDAVNVKKRVLTTLLTYEECKQSFLNSGRRKLTPGTHICTKDTDTNTHFSCQGDSGSPIMYRSRRAQWHIVGFQIWGRECGKEFPHVSTNVSNYLTWIQESMRPW